MLVPRDAVNYPSNRVIDRTNCLRVRPHGSMAVTGAWVVFFRARARRPRLARRPAERVLLRSTTFLPR